jgi:hypothetical protein
VTQHEQENRDEAMTAQEDQRQLLISRIVDAAASEADWTRFRSLAAQDDGLWQRLAEAQAAQQQLTRALEPTLIAADQVALPVVVRDESPRPVGIIRWPAWAGWAVAALVAVMWWTGGGWLPMSQPAPTPSQSTSTQQAGWPVDFTGVSQARTTPSDLLGAYLQSDHIVGQGALQPIDTVETPEGTQVLIMRPIYERVRLEPQYLDTLNEQGELVPRRVPRTAVDLVDYAL